MSPLTFTLIYLSIGYLILSSVWLISAFREHKLGIMLNLRLTMIVQAILGMLNLLSGLLFPLPLTPEIPTRSFGLTLFTLGLMVAVWARLVMKNNWNAPGTLDTKHLPKIVKVGPFSFSRNPIYLGIILISFGMAIALHSQLFILTYFLYIHLYTEIRNEEKKLQKYFGDEYTKYRLEVPRFI
ncbi:MAG: isoprenylcysteine carboxylmethyltransferase family protein [Patescibacteria group bacterium]